MIWILFRREFRGSLSLWRTFLFSYTPKVLDGRKKFTDLVIPFESRSSFGINRCKWHCIIKELVINATLWYFSSFDELVEFYGWWMSVIYRAKENWTRKSVTICRKARDLKWMKESNMLSHLNRAWNEFEIFTLSLTPSVTRVSIIICIYGGIIV